jgi:hypothetical protein
MGEETPTWRNRFYEFMAEFLREEKDLPVVSVDSVSSRAESWSYSEYTGGTDYYLDVYWTDTDEKTHYDSFSGDLSDFFNVYH